MEIKELIEKAKQNHLNSEYYTTSKAYSLSESELQELMRTVYDRGYRDGLNPQTDFETLWQGFLKELQTP